jgi:hypothetical protein
MPGSGSLQDLLDLYLDGAVDPDMIDQVERIIEIETEEWRAGIIGPYRDCPDAEFDLVYQWAEQGCPAKHTPKWPGIKPRHQFRYDGKKVEYVEDSGPAFNSTPEDRKSTRLASLRSSPPLYDGTAQSVTSPEQLSQIPDEKLLSDLERLIESRVSACLERFANSPSLYRLERHDLRQEARLPVLGARERFKETPYLTALDRLAAQAGIRRPQAKRTVRFSTWITTVIDNALSDYAKRLVRQPILGEKSTTAPEIAARHAQHDEADFTVTRCALAALAPIHAQTIVADALAKDGREASEMVGVGHAAFRQRLKRALAAVGAEEDARADQRT